MTAVGIHSKPLNGVVLNGAEQPRTPPDEPGRRRRPDGDTVIRVLAAAVVLAVAAFAAIVSYSHIFELGRQHGQDGTAARLLPLSVDGLIAAASLVMLHAARRKLDVPRLARWMLALGVGATVAANIFYGLPFGWLSAVISAWPAVAFVGSVEMAVRFVRDARHDTPPVTQPPVAPVTPPPVAHDDSKGDKPKAKRVIAGVTNAELAAREGVSVRTLQRRRKGTKP